MGNSNGHEADFGSPTPEGRSRILSIDPRSPSAEISRTPIVVNKTPEGVLQDPHDPRSPTIGIDRTPLAPWQNVRPAVQRAEYVEHSVQEQEEEEDNVKDTEPLCDCEGEINEQEVFDPLGVTGIQEITLEDFPNCESTRLVPDEKMMLEVKDKIRLNKKKQKAARPKELFPVKNSTNTKDSTRSPLASRTIDMNSPAKLVQRKQIKDLDKKMTCAQENSLSRFVVRDKENM